MVKGALGVAKEVGVDQSSACDTRTHTHTRPHIFNKGSRYNNLNVPVVYVCLRVHVYACNVQKRKIFSLFVSMTEKLCKTKDTKPF